MPEIRRIASRQNPYIQLVSALSDRKGRERERLFRFDGIKLLREALACGIEPETVLVAESRADDLLPDILTLCPEERIILLSEGAFDKISEEKAPEGVITVAKYIDKLHKIATINNITASAGSDGRIIALESLRDPGNLGTVIRSAAAFGYGTLILSDDCADIYSPRTLRASMGAVFSREILTVTDLPSALFAMKKCGRRVLAATLSPSARPIGEWDFTERDCVVIGNEGHGLTRETVGASDGCVILPICAGPGVESLNAAVAATLFMWEGARAAASRQSHTASE